MATSFMAPCSSSPGRHCHSSQQGLPEPSQRPQPGGEGEGNAGPNSQRTWPPSPQGAVPSLTAGTALCWQCAPRARASPQNPRASKLPAPHLTSPCTNHSHTQKLHRPWKRPPPGSPTLCHSAAPAHGEGTPALPMHRPHPLGCSPRGQHSTPAPHWRGRNSNTRKAGPEVRAAGTREPRALQGGCEPPSPPQNPGLLLNHGVPAALNLVHSFGPCGPGSALGTGDKERFRRAASVRSTQTRVVTGP